VIENIFFSLIPSLVKVHKFLLDNSKPVWGGGMCQKLRILLFNIQLASTKWAVKDNPQY